MSVRKGLLKDTELCDKVVGLYTGHEKPTTVQVAQQLGETEHNVQYILRNRLPKDVLEAEQSLRYSRGKVAALNPMYGKLLEESPRWKGAVSDNKGHLTIKTASGKRVFVHRKVLADALGITLEQMKKFDIHHIDGNGENNSLDNLALVTKKGHHSLHRVWSKLKDSPLWERYRSSISQ